MTFDVFWLLSLKKSIPPWYWTQDLFLKKKKHMANENKLSCRKTNIGSFLGSDEFCRPLHGRIQKVLLEGVQTLTTFFLVDEGRKDPKYHYKRAIIGPPAKCHFMAFR